MSISEHIKHKTLHRVLNRIINQELLGHQAPLGPSSELAACLAPSPNLPPSCAYDCQTRPQSRGHHHRYLLLQCWRGLHMHFPSMLTHGHRHVQSPGAMSAGEASVVATSSGIEWNIPAALPFAVGFSFAATAPVRVKPSGSFSSSQSSCRAHHLLSCRICTSTVLPLIPPSAKRF